MKKVNYQNISLEKENISLEILTCGLMSMTGEYFRLPTFTTFTLFLPGLHIPGFILIPSIGDPGCATWDPHSSNTSQEPS